MTGAEIVGGAVVAAKGVKAAADVMGGDADERQQLARLGEGLPAMSQAAQAKAHRVAIRQKFLTKCMAPLAVWVGHKIEYFDPETGQFANDLAEKMADVPEESIISPAPVIAAQSIEGLSYSLDEPDLKKMYLNLLATASDDRRAHEAHPSFAQIIKQLSSPEAELLLSVLTATPRGTPMVELRSNSETGGFRTLRRHLFNVVDAETGDVSVPEPMFIDNWVRLGLVEANYTVFRNSDGAYDWVDEHPAMIQLREFHEELPDRTAGYERGILIPTALGIQFADAVTPADGTK